MPEEERPAAPEEEAAEPGADEGPPPTPFDHPAFLPVLLWGFAAWFGYDIVTNAPAYQEWPNFNRGGFAILSVLALYYSWRAVREIRESRSRSE